MPNQIKVYTNYQVNGYHTYFTLIPLKNALNIKPDESFYALPKGYEAVVLSDEHPAIKCPDGEFIEYFTDRSDCPTFETHDGKYVALKLIKE